MPSVLFVCVANSCRSQMAEAFAKVIGKDRWDIWSAGSSPSGQVHPLAIELMREVGLDLTRHRSKGVSGVPTKTWDYVVTMGCGDNCPTVSARQRINWDIPDPIGLPLKDARQIRDRIRTLVVELMGQATGPAGPRTSRSTQHNPTRALG